MSDDRSYRKALPLPSKGRCSVRISVKFDDGGYVQLDLKDCDPERVKKVMGDGAPSFFGPVTEADNNDDVTSRPGWDRSL
jgi:hypothetical protein